MDTFNTSEVAVIVYLFILLSTASPRPECEPLAGYTPDRKR